MASREDALATLEPEIRSTSRQSGQPPRSEARAVTGRSRPLVTHTAPRRSGGATAGPASCGPLAGCATRVLGWWAGQLPVAGQRGALPAPTLPRPRHWLPAARRRPGGHGWCRIVTRGAAPEPEARQDVQLMGGDARATNLATGTGRRLPKGRLRLPAGVCMHWQLWAGLRKFKLKRQ